MNPQSGQRDNRPTHPAVVEEQRTEVARGQRAVDDVAYDEEEHQRDDQGVGKTGRLANDNLKICSQRSFSFLLPPRL